MADLGLSQAFGADATAQRLRQQIMDKMAAQQQAQQADIKNRGMALQEQEAQRRGQEFQQSLDEKKAVKQDAQNSQDEKAAATAFTLNPVGATLAPKLALRGRMMGLPINTVPGVAGPAATQGLPSLDAPTSGAPLAPESTPDAYTRGATQADLEKNKADEIAAAKQAELERNNQANNDIKTHLNDITEKVRQGQMNNQEAMLAIRERLASVAEQNAATKADGKNKPLVLSQGGKSAKAAIEQAGPLTDQVIAMIEKEAPDIGTNPEKYNSLMSKGTSLLQTAKYKLGFHDDTDPRQQLVSLLQPIQAGQYTRSSRSRQMLELALKHMADPSQTLLTQYQRAKELKSIMPEMLSGIVRAETPVDPANPLAGSYFDPNKGAAAPSGAPSSETPEQRSARLRKAAGL